MYIFPKNTKLSICVILFSVVYIGFAIICALSYVDRQLDESKIDIQKKSRAPIHYGQPHQVSYYDEEKLMLDSFFSLNKINVPTGQDYFNKYQGIKEFYWLFPYTPEKPTVKKWRIPWIIECNKVTTGISCLGEYSKLHIFPYAIGFKKHSNNKRKDAEIALLHTLDYFKNKCSATEQYENLSRIFFQPSFIHNRYHYTKVVRLHGSDKPITTDSIFVRYSGHLPMCHDVGPCRVYMQYEDHNAVYSVACDKNMVVKDKIKYCLLGLLSWILLLTLFLYAKQQYTKNKIHKLNLPLYERLKIVCNPKNFTKPYDKEKIILANEVYNQLLQMDRKDEESIYELYLKANKELGINVLDPSRLDQLEELTNPSLFMSPYDEQKVLLANKLYSKLKNRDTLLYREYVYIEKEVEDLYNK